MKAFIKDKTQIIPVEVAIGLYDGKMQRNH
jgi:hypothetical protein